MAGPLEGYRVVELAEGIAGPYTAMQLGDAGADVIKIEHLAGDRARSWGSTAKDDLGAQFLHLNRNKRSVALDLDTPEGVAAARRLIDGADVVVADEGWTRAEALSSGALMAANAQLVYCNTSEFGGEGPWAGRAPYGELAAQMASEATTSLGVIGEAPVRIGPDVASMFTAIYAVQAICAALLARRRNGGQRIDMSLFGSMISMRTRMWTAMTNPDEWWGFHLDTYVKPPDYGYQCRDGAILFSLGGMRQEQRDELYEAFEMTWVKDDPLYETVNRDGGGSTGRYSHIAKPVWDRAFSRFTVEEVIDITRRLGGQAYPKQDYETLVDSPQAQHVGMITTVDHPDVGPVRMQIPPWEFHDTPAEIRLPAPRLGEHGFEVLAERGFSAGEIAALRTRSILA